MHGVIDHDGLKGAVASSEAQCGHPRVSVCAGLPAAIHREIEMAFSGYDFALLCLAERGLGSLAQTPLEDLHVGWVIEAALVEMNRARAGMRVRRGQHDLPRSQPQSLSRPVTELQHYRTINADEVAVDPEHSLAAVLQVKRLGEQRIEHASGGLSAGGKAG